MFLDFLIIWCYIYDILFDQIIVVLLDVFVCLYGDIEILGLDFNGYVGFIKCKVELIEKMKIVVKNLSNYFFDDELEIFEIWFCQNFIVDDINNYNLVINVIFGFGVLFFIEEKNLKNCFYVISFVL